MVRCEYCGQLYEGLSCPHCCAPRGEPEPVEHNGASSDDCPEWILTNSSCVGNNNVQVIGDNNVVNGWLYADNMLYYVYDDVRPEDQPSERDEAIDAICGTCSHDAQISTQVKELAEEQVKKCQKDRCRWEIINFACAWFGTLSLCVVIGAPIVHSIGIATAFCGILFGLMNINNCDD